LLKCYQDKTNDDSPDLSFLNDLMSKNWIKLPVQ
jgi:hypothetical protein